MSMPVPPALSVGRRLVELCQKGQFHEAMQELYADDARHVEPYPMGEQMPQETTGKPALLQGSQYWMEANEMHGGEVKGPFPHGDDRFAMWCSLDVTPKAGPMAGKRHVMQEICLYTVRNGKIVLAEFFWDPSPMAGM